MEHIDDKHLLGGADPQKAATPLHVPTGYFDSLTPRMMQAVRQDQAAQKESGASFSFGWMKIVGTIGAVATFTLLAIVGLDLTKGPGFGNIDLAKATEGLTIEEVVVLTDAGPDDLVVTGLLLPDTLSIATFADDDAAMQLLIESGIDDEMIEDLEI